MISLFFNLFINLNIYIYLSTSPLYLFIYLSIYISILSIHLPINLLPIDSLVPVSLPGDFLILVQQPPTLCLLLSQCLFYASHLDIKNIDRKL